MSEKLKTVIKSRAAARGWAKRCSLKLDELCDSFNPDVDIIELTDAIEEFDRRLGTLDDTQIAVEFELDEIALEEDIMKAAELRETSKRSWLRAKRLIGECKVTASGNEGSIPPPSPPKSISSNMAEASLPRLELPVFTGDVMSWMSFWEQFEAVVDSSDLPDITKFSYLQSLLKGEAKAAIQGLSLTSANYQAACDILKKRFGRKEKIIFSHIQELLSLNIQQFPGTSILWKLLDDIQAHVRSLESLGISGKQYGVVLTPLILSRLPPELRMEWARDGKEKEGDLEFLLTFLQREIERRERSQTFGNEETYQWSSQTRTSTDVVPTCSALHSVAKNKQICMLCSRQGHTIENCFSVTKVPVDERKEVLRRVGACFRCLSVGKGHIYAKCKAKCSRCKGKHHVLLCKPKHSSDSSFKTEQTSKLPQQTSKPTADSEILQKPTRTFYCRLLRW